MKIVRMLPLIAGSLCWAGGLVAAETSTNATLDPHLEPLRPLLGKTWRGPFKNSKPEKPVVDIMRWERALN
ncbi:MAG TPA: hypothetical protein VJS65_17050, partial [Verrucomicrobiae bacterium]|nr:hypothetical protein [Verrucomicrobiae bacterium]